MFTLALILSLLAKWNLVPLADDQTPEFELAAANGYFDKVVVDPDGYAIAWHPVDPAEVWRPQQPGDLYACYMKVVVVGPIRAFRCYSTVCISECQITPRRELLPDGSAVWFCKCGVQ